ncbi:type VI secretion protein [Cystobacter fuscus]|uniref:PAAR domain-containing protein n=1 Tax=Cystobacter fuscus TaxID=43 RepID=UPI00097152C6|nr:type VI secretion protein [Cystobacter fuscus]
MPPAARVGDLQSCPLVNPGPVPHIGGPVSTGEDTVIIEGQPAARVGDPALCTGVGSETALGSGSPTVIIGRQKAARLGDTSCHGGKIVTGAATVFIGDAGYSAMSTARESGAPFVSISTEE